MKYQIVSAYPYKGSLFKSENRPLDEVLTTKVNELMDKGWQPIGGVAINSMGGFFQAMIYRPAPKPAGQ